MATRGKRVRESLAVVLGGLLVFVPVGFANANGTSSGTKAFCRPSTVVKNFLAPLDKLPPSNGFSISGKLTREGPKVLRVYPPRESLVMSDHGQFEAVGDLDGGRHGDDALNWVVDSVLTLVKENGRQETVIQRKKQHIVHIAGFQGRSFGFSGQVKPGIYRLDVIFREKSGKTLTHRAEWFRVMEPFSDVRLAADATNYRSGDTGSLRVLNYGNVKSTYSFSYRMRSEVGAVGLPLEETGIISALRPVVLPGGAGSCFRFHVPRGTPAGNYEVGVRGSNRLLAAPRGLWAKFVVE